MRKEGPAVPADASRSGRGAQGRAWPRRLLLPAPCHPPRPRGLHPALPSRSPASFSRRSTSSYTSMASSSKRRLLSCSSTGDSVRQGERRRRDTPRPCPGPHSPPAASSWLPWPAQRGPGWGVRGKQKVGVIPGLFPSKQSPAAPQQDRDPPQALGASPSRAGGQAQEDEVAGGEQDPPPRVPPRCQAGPRGQGCWGGPCQQHGGPPEPRAERTIPLCHALWAHPALRRRQRREEQDKGGR